MVGVYIAPDDPIHLLGGSSLFIDDVQTVF
jgi:hypothetical protein